MSASRSDRTGGECVVRQLLPKIQKLESEESESDDDNSSANASSEAEKELKRKKGKESGRLWKIWQPSILRKIKGGKQPSQWRRR